MKEDKIQLWFGGGIAIGWDFDLRYNRFRVTPKPAAMDKLVKYLFLELTTDRGSLDGHVLDKDPLTNKYIRPSIPCKTIETLRAWSTLSLRHGNSTGHLPCLFPIPNGYREQRQC